jgi:hypothetical protein
MIKRRLRFLSVRGAFLGSERFPPLNWRALPILVEENSIMRVSRLVALALTACAAVTTQAGCLGGGSQMAPIPVGHSAGAGFTSVPQQTAQNIRTKEGLFESNTAIGSGHAVTAPSFLSPGAKGKPLIFVSDGTNNVVDIFLRDRKNKIVCQVTGLNFPYGLATDIAGNLYVANSENIPVYAPPYTGTPTLILDDTGYFSLSVAVSSLGVVGVVNQCNAPSCTNGTGSVTIYARNSTTPCATLTDSTNFPNGVSGSFDDKGTFYIDGHNLTGETVLGEITGGCQAKKIRPLTTSNNIRAPGGIHVSKHDQIAILDSAPSGSNGPVIYSYRHPKMGSLGDPFSTTHLTTQTFPIDFALLRSGTALYTVEQGSGDFANEYDYPTGGAAENTIIIGGSPFGVAVTPPLLP